MATKDGKKTGGRKKGTPNKVAHPVRELAQKHGPEAIAKLVYLMHEGDSHSVQLGAAKELLDRAYGKAPQAHMFDEGAQITGPVMIVTGIVRDDDVDPDSPTHH